MPCKLHCEGFLVKTLGDLEISIGGDTWAWQAQLKEHLSDPPSKTSAIVSSVEYRVIA